MSTVTITYGLRSLKVKATPGTPTGELLDKAAKHFNTDPATTGLFHNKTELSTSLPFRLLNLPAGAKLTLDKSKSKKEADITIKIQFINGPFEQNSIVKKLRNTLKLRDVLEIAETELGAKIINQGYNLKFQTLTKSGGEDDLESTLAQFGVENNGLLRITFASSNIVAPPSGTATEKASVDSSVSASSSSAATSSRPLNPTKTVSIPDPKPEGSPVQAPYPEESTCMTNYPPEPHPVSRPQPQASLVESSSEPMDVDEASVPPAQPANVPEEEPKHVYVYKPTSGPILPVDEPDESTYEVTVNHARQYQNLLSQRAHETAKAKRERLALNKKVITNVEVRVRFPDDSNLQVNFKPNERNSDIYEFIKGTLMDSTNEFQLSIPYPQQIISNDGTKLIDNLESRNLLLFKPLSAQGNGPFLKPEFLQQAKDLKEAEDVKLDRERSTMKDDDDDDDQVRHDGKIQNGVLPKKSKSIGKHSEEDSGGKKVPKWLKFGKK